MSRSPDLFLYHVLAYSTYLRPGVEVCAPKNLSFSSADLCWLPAMRTSPSLKVLRWIYFGPSLTETAVARFHLGDRSSIS